MDILIEGIEIDSALRKQGAGKGPLTSLRSSVSNPQKRSMRDVAPKVERSEGESTSVSSEQSDSDADEGDNRSQGRQVRQGALGIPMIENDDGMDDEQYAQLDIVFKESQSIQPKLTATMVDSHQYDLEAHFVQRGNNGEGSPLKTGINFVLPDINDRAHHHRKGTCFYWVLPYCGLRLPLTTFECSLLRVLDVTPSQLTPPTWCHIASFQQLFLQVPGLIELEPTLPVFGVFVNLYFTSVEHLALRQKISKAEDWEGLFTSNYNPRVKKVNDWKTRWVYVGNPSKVESLRRV